MRITLPATFQLIAEKNTPTFLCCPQLTFSAPLYPVFPAGRSQRDASDWTLGVKASLCKKTVDCLSRNFSSRHSCKVTSAFCWRVNLNESHAWVLTFIRFFSPLVGNLARTRPSATYTPLNRKGVNVCPEDIETR
ncbi:hypothetical protein TNCV_4076351 [Trichonephila clavipes]|nr:hypothetical protein TNCV_4076351 [Trichonephila clavipes]